MKGVFDLFTLAIVCIMIYLFVRNGDATANIITSFSGFVTNSFKTLQGR